jgi:hypothetical protein
MDDGGVDRKTCASAETESVEQLHVIELSRPIRELEFHVRANGKAAFANKSVRGKPISRSSHATVQTVTVGIGRMIACPLKCAVYETYGG